jgi:hypothetical protein
MAMAQSLKPRTEFDGSGDEPVHRTADDAIADRGAEDTEKICCICGEPVGDERIQLHRQSGYDVRINYTHPQCLRTALA